MLEEIAERLAERMPVRLPLAVACAVALAATGALVWQVWRWQQQPASAAPGSAPTTVAGEVQDPLPIILSGNLFGSAATRGGAASPAATTRAATGYTLRAAFAGTGGSGGAIIEPNGGEARWVGVGQNLPDGVRLHEVHPDHVMLDRQGSLERLDFPRLTELAAAVAPAASSTGVITTSPGAGESRAEPIPADAAPDEKARLIRQRLEELRNRSRT